MSAKQLFGAMGMDRDAYQFDGDTSMNRDKWEFQYTARNLADAARRQRDFRNERVKAWEEKKAEVMAKVKETGLTVDESVADQFVNYTQAGLGWRGAQIMVDVTLQKDLSECVTKIREHRDAAKEYDSWLQVLDAHPESRMSLKLNDWMFFFGK